jgi:hypothetical protein
VHRELRKRRTKRATLILGDLVCIALAGGFAGGADKRTDRGPHRRGGPTCPPKRCDAPRRTALPQRRAEGLLPWRRIREQREARTFRSSLPGRRHGQRISWACEGGEGSSSYDKQSRTTRTRWTGCRGASLHAPPPHTRGATQGYVGAAPLADTSCSCRGHAPHGHRLIGPRCLHRSWPSISPSQEDVARPARTSVRAARSQENGHPESECCRTLLTPSYQLPLPSS